LFLKKKFWRENGTGDDSSSVLVVRAGLKQTALVTEATNLKTVFETLLKLTEQEAGFSTT
jgi:hypothetical protein